MERLIIKLLKNTTLRDNAIKIQGTKTDLSTGGCKMCKFSKAEPRILINYPYLCKLFKKHS